MNGSKGPCRDERSCGQRTTPWRRMRISWELAWAELSNIARYLARLPNRKYRFEKAAPHNDYLLLFVETGLLGVTLYNSCLCFLIVTLLRRYRNSQFQGCILILISTTVYLALVQVVRNAFCDPGLWLFLALATLSCRHRFQTAGQIHVQLIEAPMK